MSLLLLRAALLLTAVTLPLQAQDWPRFRGPNGSGLGKANLPDAITEKDFNWKIELPGPGHSSPVVAGGRIFLTCTPKGSTKRILVCLDAKDGKQVWQREYETAAFRLHSDNSLSASSPAADAERVYVSWMSPEGSGVAALDQKDGKELWKKELGPYISQHGPGASPVVVEDMVVLDFDQDGPKSFLLALDAKTGAERWRWEHEGGKHSSSTPCVFTPKSGGAQIVTISFAAGMSAVDAKTGKLAWQLPGLLPKRCVSSAFTTESGLVIAQCGEGRAESFVYAVRPDDAGKTAQKVYEVVRVGGYVPTPIVVGDLLFLWKENGLVSCLRAATNEQLWSERVEGPFYGSPVAVNGKLYNMTVRGDLIALVAGEKFQPPARIPLGEGSHATPAVAGGRMYLRTFSHLISVGK